MTLFGSKGAVSSCFKQLSSNLNLSLDLFHGGLGERVYLLYKGGLNFSGHNY